MIAYVKGIVEDIAQDTVVVDVGGIGYNVKVSDWTIARIPVPGEPIKLYTYTLVREDTFALYGFLSKDELELFKQCISVSGIGPKGGQAILSVLDADALRLAIVNGDTKAIAKAPGIGAKTAQRLVLELKDKIKISSSVIDLEIDLTNEQLHSTSISNVKKDAVEALVLLGYGQTESIQAVNRIENADSMDSGTILKEALKKLF